MTGSLLSQGREQRLLDGLGLRRLLGHFHGRGKPTHHSLAYIQHTGHSTPIQDGENALVIIVCE